MPAKSLMPRVAGLLVACASLACGEAMAASSEVANRGTAEGFGDAMSSSARSAAEKSMAKAAAPGASAVNYEAWVTGSYSKNKFTDSAESMSQDMKLAIVGGGAMIDERYIVGGGLAHGWVDTTVRSKTSTSVSKNETLAKVVALYGGYLPVPSLLLDVMVQHMWMDQDERQNNGVTSKKDLTGWAGNIGATYTHVYGDHDFGLKADYHMIRIETDAYTDSAGSRTGERGTIQRKLSFTGDTGYTIGRFHPSVSAGYEWVVNPVRDGRTDQRTDGTGWLLGLGLDINLDPITVSLAGHTLVDNDNNRTTDAMISIKGRF